MHSSLKAVAALFVAATVVPCRANALEPNCATITRSNLVECALRASLQVKSERHTLRAAEAREEAAATVLPRNPELELLAGSRKAPGGGDGLHWSARLSQELEIGGQRGLRRREAAADSEAAKQRLLMTRRLSAAQAWAAYFDLARAERQRRVAARLEAMARQMDDAAAAMSSAGVLAPMEADLTNIARARARQALLAAESEVRTSELTLRRLLGAEPEHASLKVNAELTPIADVTSFARRALGAGQSDVPEVLALEAENRAASARSELMRSARVPNLTLSAFLERDKFEGQLVGGGVSIPLPLPAPLGRTFSGAIAENEALSARARSEAERVRREARSALTAALTTYESRDLELQTLAADRVALAEQSLEGLANEVKLGRLRVRDALLTEEQLVEFVRARIEAEYALCVASLSLARAASFPLEGSAP